MSVDLMREIVVEAVLNDPYDGAIRLLGDAQRFGFELQSLMLTARPAGMASATITLRVPTSIEGCWCISPSGVTRRTDSEV